MTTEKTFTFPVTSRTAKTVPSLRVEAWDNDLFFDDFLAEAVADSDGRFSMSTSGRRFEELFADLHPVRTLRMGVK